MGWKVVDETGSEGREECGIISVLKKVSEHLRIHKTLKHGAKWRVSAEGVRMLAQGLKTLNPK